MSVGIIELLEMIDIDHQCGKRPPATNGARQFALGMKRDPNSWYDMKKVLPLLAQPEYYERLKSGRARGGEAVILVENVRTYYDILVRFEAPRRSPLQMGFAMQ